MFYVKLIQAVAFLWVIYIIFMLCHIYGLFKVTNRKITFWRMIIPFYYWIAPQQEKLKK